MTRFEGSQQESLTVASKDTSRGIPLISGRTWNIQLSGVELSAARWSTETARCGESVAMTTRVGGSASDGAAVVFRIFEKDSDGQDDFVAEVPGTLAQGEATAHWTYRYIDDKDDPGSQDSQPEYYFICQLAGAEARSGLLEFRDIVEIECLDLFGNPRADAPYTLLLPNGDRRSGTLDAAGRAKVEDVPPGRYRLLV